MLRVHDDFIACCKVTESSCFAASANFVFDLESSEALMVQNFTDMALLEKEMGMREVNESDARNE